MIKSALIYIFSNLLSGFGDCGWAAAVETGIKACPVRVQYSKKNSVNFVSLTIVLQRKYILR